MRHATIRYPTGRHLRPVHLGRKLAALLAALVAMAGGIAVAMSHQPAAQASSSGWISICSYTRSLPDDPIMAPDMAGMSHLHDFFGNRSTVAGSTAASMRAAATSCGTVGDTAGYWAPALYRNGVKIDPVGFRLDGKATRNTFYYRADNLRSSYHITAFPAGFELVAGNSHATSAAANPYLGREIYWGCSDNSTGKLTTPPNCSTGTISLHIGFPNCWDGVVGRGNDTSHVVYPSSYRCPASNPIALPRLIMRLEYPVGRSSAGITLASGPTYTIHGDFWNTWDQAVLQRLVVDCLNQHTNCGNDPTP